MAKYNLDSDAAEAFAETILLGQAGGDFSMPCGAITKSEQWLADRPGITLREWIEQVQATGFDASKLGFAVVSSKKYLRKLYDDDSLVAMQLCGSTSLHGGLVIRQVFGDDLPDNVLDNVRHLDVALKAVAHHKKYRHQ
jgi:hypothetical protein